MRNVREDNFPDIFKRRSGPLAIFDLNCRQDIAYGSHRFAPHFADYLLFIDTYVVEFFRLSFVFLINFKASRQPAFNQNGQFIQKCLIKSVGGE